MRRGGATCGSVACVLAMAAPVAAGPPPPDVPPTISFGSTAGTIAEGPIEPCSDAFTQGIAVLPLTVEDPDGAPDGTAPLAIEHTEVGTAVAGLDYSPLSPSFSPLEARVSALPRPGPATTVTVAITLQPGAGYTVGTPDTFVLTIEHLDRRCEPPTFTDAATNVSQSIHVGQRPEPLQLVDPVNGTAFAAVIDGRLPPGVDLARDGTFTGAASAPGTFVATVGSCRPAFTAPPGLCTRVVLTITVLGVAVARTG